MAIWSDEGQEVLDELSSVGVTDFNGGNYIVNLDTDITYVLDGFIMKSFDALWSNLNSFIIALLALWTVIQALRFMNGKLGVDAGSIAWQLLSAPLAIVVWSSWLFFDEYIYTLFMELPISFGALLMKSTGSVPFGVENPLSAIDLFARKTMLTLEIIDIEGGGFRKYAFQVCIFIIGILLIVPLVAGLLLSKIGISVSLAVAPIFVLFLLFDLTRGLFEGWLKQLFGYSILVILVYSVIALVLNMMHFQMLRLSSSFVNDGLSSGSLFTFIAIGSVLIYFVWQMQGMATAIAGSFVMKPFTPGAGTLAAGAVAMRASKSDSAKAIGKGVSQAAGKIGRAVKQALGGK